MARFRHLQCPDCEGTWKWLQHPSDEPLPNFCPRCGSNLTAEPVFVPEAAHIARSIGKTADGVYRQMESASEEHAYLAAEMTGDHASDYSGMKITDLPDYLRPGDIAAKLPERLNPVSEAIAAGRGGFGVANGLTGAEYAQATGQGVFPRAGDAMRQSLQSTHAAVQRAVEGTGLVDSASRGRRR